MCGRVIDGELMERNGCSPEVEKAEAAWLVSTWHAEFSGNPDPGRQILYDIRHLTSPKYSLQIYLLTCFP